MEPVALNCEMVRSLFYMMSRKTEFREALVSFALSHRTALYTVSNFARREVNFIFQDRRLIFSTSESAIIKNYRFTGIFKRVVKSVAVFYNPRMDLDYVLRFVKDMDNLAEVYIFARDPTVFWKLVEANNKFYILFLNVELLRKLKEVSSDYLPNVLSLRLIGTPDNGCVKLTKEIFPYLRHLAFCKEKMTDLGIHQYVAMNQVVSPGMTAELVLKMFETGEAPERQIKPKGHSWWWDSDFITILVIASACWITFVYQFFWYFCYFGEKVATLIVNPEL